MKRLLGLCTWSGLVATVLLTVTTSAFSTNPKKPKIDKETKATFDSTCATCHGADGAGTPLGKSLEAADLRSAAVQRRPTPELVNAVTNGKGNMPPFKGNLTDEQIRALIAYVRTLSKPK